MKLHQSTNQAYQTVTGYDEHGVEINAVRFDYTLVVMPEVAPAPWANGPFSALTVEDFAALAERQPDVVLLGTGKRQRFIHPKLVAPLTALRVGVECMDNQAACRTYNILMGEGRKVLLALLMDPADLA